MKLETSYLIPGMILSEDIILDKNEDVILKKGCTLTNRDIIKITERGIEEVGVVISDEFNTFNKQFDELVNEILKTNSIERYLELAKLYKKISKQTDIFKYNVAKYLTVDEQMSRHNVNVINLAVIIASKYNSITEKSAHIPIDTIAIAAILQDIGRTAKDEYILARLRSKYSEEIKRLIDEYPNLDSSIFDTYDSKYHPVYSYLISLNYDLSEAISKSILLHHEKEFGDSLIGVELSKLDSQHLSTKIASILKLVDLFDVLLSKSVLDNPEKPFHNISKKMDKMVSGGYTNAYLTNILKAAIPIYQVGTKVLLSDSTLGLVKSNETTDYYNPIITDLNDNEIDLEKEKIEILKHYIESAKD